MNNIFNISFSRSPSVANSMLLTHHRDFLSSVRKEHQNDGFFAAAAVEKEMSLDHIDIGPDFVAVAGVFSDHAFLEYLHAQDSVDYVEENQIFKSALIRPRIEEDHVYKKESIGTLRTSRPANWGLARINQRERGFLEEYAFDTMAG